MSTRTQVWGCIIPSPSLPTCPPPCITLPSPAPSPPASLCGPGVGPGAACAVVHEDDSEAGSPAADLQGREG